MADDFRSTNPTNAHHEVCACNHVKHYEISCPGCSHKLVIVAHLMMGQTEKRDIHCPACRRELIVLLDGEGGSAGYGGLDRATPEVVSGSFEAEGAWRSLDLWYLRHCWVNNDPTDGH